MRLCPQPLCADILRSGTKTGPSGTGRWLTRIVGAPTVGGPKKGPGLVRPPISIDRESLDSTSVHQYTFIRKQKKKGFLEPGERSRCHAQRPSESLEGHEQALRADLMDPRPSAPQIEWFCSAGARRYLREDSELPARCVATRNGFPTRESPHAG